MFESDILHPFNSNNNYVNVFSSKLTVNVIPMLINGFVINIKKKLHHTYQNKNMLFPPYGRFIMAINRKLGPDDALDTVQLALQYKAKANGLLVGIDLSGDPKVSWIIIWSFRVY